MSKNLSDRLSQKVHVTLVSTTFGTDILVKMMGKVDSDLYIDL